MLEVTALNPTLVAHTTEAGALDEVGQVAALHVADHEPDGRAVDCGSASSLIGARGIKENENAHHKHPYWKSDKAPTQEVTPE